MSRRVLLVVAVAVLLGSASAQAVSLLPLTPVADESGFGSLYGSELVSNYAGGGFAGVLKSRVYVDALPATQVTFVYELQVTLAFANVSNLSIGSEAPDPDLRIGEIIGGINGYVVGTTTKIPDTADAINNVWPTYDDLMYGWIGANEMTTGDVAVIYIQTTGAVDVGEVDAAIQDGGVSYARVLAPVDDPNSPDLDVPEPASLSLLGLGALALIRRRRRA